MCALSSFFLSSVLYLSHRKRKEPADCTLFLSVPPSSSSSRHSCQPSSLPQQCSRTAPPPPLSVHASTSPSICTYTYTHSYLYISVHEAPNLLCFQRLAPTDFFSPLPLCLSACPLPTAPMSSWELLCLKRPLVRASPFERTTTQQPGLLLRIQCVSMPAGVCRVTCLHLWTVHIPIWAM